MPKVSRKELEEAREWLNSQEYLKDKEISYCKRCKEKTVHKKKGFQYHNQRLECLRCKEEIWLE